jgi:ABC-type antimicrobial peptide transport system permease subunit
MLDRQLLIFGDTVSVVGIVPDVKYHRLNERERPYVYAPLWRLASSSALWPLLAVVRTGAETPALPRLIETKLREYAPEVAPFSSAQVDDQFASALLPQRLSLFLLGACSLLAFVIALVGVYSLATFFALSHRRELALRIALGAQPQSVVRRVLAHGLLRVVIGAALGSLGVVLGMRAARSLLYGVAPTDPSALLIGTGAVVLAAMLASFIPARLAARMDAMRVLRQD